MPPRPECHRYWLISSTTYGTRLPGDPRGTTGNIRDDVGHKYRDNHPHTPLNPPLPALHTYTLKTLNAPPVRLGLAHAQHILEQWHETAAYRHWFLMAVSIMDNHFHCVLGVPGDPAPPTLLQSLKAYASRRLNIHFPRPASKTWWTESGSNRKLPTELAVLGAIRYVLNQPVPLLIWTAAIPELNLTQGLKT
jgi:REP element-mobilizing transposase RayT